MNNPFPTEKERCFMCRETRNGWYCYALDVKECPGKLCSTYKTSDEVYAQKRKCKERIDHLPADVRKWIKDRYGEYR